MEKEILARDGGLKVALLSLILVGGLTGIASVGAAYDKRQSGPLPCVDVVLNPPDVVLDPGCSAVMTSSSTMGVGQGSSPLELSAELDGPGAHLTWEVPANWTDGDADNGELDRIQVLRGSSPVTLETLAVTGEDVRTFEDDSAVRQGGTWYQLVAIGEDGNALSSSDRVLVGPM